MFPGRKQVVIIGGGISGLCAAYFLKKQGIDVLVLEHESAPGGTMKSLHEKGWLVETGPNSALETTPLFKQIFDDVGITGDRLYANEAASRRYILRNGTLHPLPTGPGDFFTSKLWSVGGKLRLLKEPFIGRATKEESIAEFVERRLGREFLDYAINPFIAGVYAGNPETLSVQSALPKIYALEEKYGGLIKGMLKGRQERKKRAEVAKDRAKLFSFREGMHTLPRALASYLGESVICGASVEHIVPMRVGKFPVYTISLRKDDAQSTIEAPAVILSTPAHVASGIIERIDPEMARTLNSIYYPPVAEVFLGYRRAQVKHPLDGFGFLIPGVENRNILGSLWSSTLFPGRAPDGCVALTTFVGGSRQPELLALDDENLRQVVEKEFRTLLGATGDPVFERVIRWQRAIPQYTLGYHKVLKAMDRFEENFRGAFICSNFRGGISVGDCVMSAEKTAMRVQEFLAR